MKRTKDGTLKCPECNKKMKAQDKALTVYKCEECEITIFDK